MDKAKIAELQRMVENSKRIVFFGGAGVSTESGIPDFRSPGGLFDTSSNSVRASGTSTTESGIPDFRSVDGLYNQKYDFPPEEILNIRFFNRNPEVYFRFYREKILITGVQPNPAHYKLAQWEKEGKLSAVITQNIDGLHQKAGSKKVFELHGSIHRNYCVRCGKTYTAEEMAATKGVPACTECGYLIRPDVVHYGEGLNQDTIRSALYELENADMLIVGGTSLSVYPAAGMIDVFRGKHLVLINKTATNRDADADLIIREPIGQVLSQL